MYSDKTLKSKPADTITNHQTCIFLPFLTFFYIHSVTPNSPFLIYIYIYNRNKKVYFGSKQGEFKTRYYNHRTSFTHEKYRHSTTLSSYVWEVKDKKGIDPILKCEVIKKCRKYRAGDKDCLLCNEEKLAIAFCQSRNMLNQRSEVLNSCKHKRGWLLFN